MPQDLRVALLSLNFAPEPTGIAPYSTALARRLNQIGLATRVITAHPHYPGWRVAEGYGEWSRFELVEGVPVHRVRHYVPSRPKGLLRLLSELTFGARVFLAKWGRVDAVIAVSPALFSTALAWLRWRLSHRRVPFIVWVQDLYSLGLAETGQGRGLAASVSSRVEGALFRRATRVVVIHERFAARVVEDLGVDPARIDVVRNWTHLAPFHVIDRDAARARLGWDPLDTVVLHAGNIGVKQGLENVVAAARLSQHASARVRFVLLGGGSERSRLVKEASGLGTIEFREALDDEAFQEALQAADVLLVNERPGVAEMAVPSKLTSYFAAGRPVIAATEGHGITAHEIGVARAGVVIPPGDPARLLQCVRELVSNADRCAEFGRNGREYQATVLAEGSAISAFASLIRLAASRAAR
ncbi:glycosyltransferase family 4 protein [Agrococcus citreus]|uniref:D-inositol 3-phosphate glycosyltransferase n=1 Tax=Agrococcus citreus TaxID=84643 RepID=A0ABN1YRP1_9MICO